MVRRANLCIRCENKRRVEAYAGNSNPNWKEGKSSNKGYISVRVKTGSPGKGKGSFYRGEHIVVWERANNKRLPQGWVVHHLNGVKNDNRIENLAGMPRHEHHSHPRKALHPYERRIKQLEDQLHKCQQLKME